MNKYQILDFMEILFLSLALLLTILYVARELKQKRLNLNHYSIFFLFFLSGWIFMELLDHQSIINLNSKGDTFDFIFLLVIAIWLNLRFIRAIKLSRSESL